jgi:hypothetical protein
MTKTQIPFRLCVRRALALSLNSAIATVCPWQGQANRHQRGTRHARRIEEYNIVLSSTIYIGATVFGSITHAGPSDLHPQVDTIVHRTASPLRRLIVFGRSGPFSPVTAHHLCFIFPPCRLPLARRRRECPDFSRRSSDTTTSVDWVADAGRLCGLQLAWRLKRQRRAWKIQHPSQRRADQKV